VELQNQAVLVDVLNTLLLKPATITLDIASILLPTFPGLLEAPYENYITTAGKSVIVILRQFSNIILSNAAPPPRGSMVDISREERHEKCSRAHSALLQIKETLPSLSQEPGKVGELVKKLQRALTKFEPL
jgi:katanin p80 WD40 repeat-containing subunit B1